ncbi:MAG: hypothetical protein IPJ00_20825 [Saprospirales bacterium]|nr:hypothetical protein [Saprospirales bacterium]
MNPLPVVTCPGNSAVCIDAGAFALTGGNPMGGTYSGPGVNAGMFNPSAAGAGAHTITYTYTDGNSCTNSCTFTITVAVQSTVTCPSNATVCINISPYALTGGNPGGGAYSGPGVNEGMFNPAAAGTGVHTITYTYPIGSNCSNWCTFTITVIPCTTISGDILWEQNEGLGVNQVTVKLTGDQTLTTTTNTSGFYSLNPGSGSNFIVTPTKTINKLNGVTVADVTAIQQHVANINLLPAPFKRIAADVNKSNTISSLDATLISQALLGNPAALNQITSWRFVPYSYTFPNPNIPWGFPEKIILTGVSGDVPNQDFKGIKLGDVVATFANPANFGAGEPLVLRAADRELQMGESFAVEIIADQMNDLAAFQFALGFDPSLVQLEGVEPLAGLPLTADHFGTFNAAQGEIRVAWSQENGLTLSEATPLFRLIFTALENGSKLSGALYLEEDILPAKAYTDALAESGVQLIIEQTTALNDLATGKTNFQLLPNFPNPFHGSTTIEFILPESCEVQLRVLNVDGQELWRVNKTYPAGNNSETLFLDGTVSSGVLYCEMVTPFGALVRKMVLMQR